MAQPSVYYYPIEGGNIREVDFGYSLQDLTPIDDYDNPTTVNGLGTPSFNPLQGRLRVKFRKERVSAFTTLGAPLVREFVALENHLRRGGIIGIALDRTKAFAAYVSTTAGAMGGGSLIEGGPNVYRDVLSASLAMAAGDTICLESGNPDWKREELKISSVSVDSTSHSITTTSAIVFDRDMIYGSGIMVRHRDFYPALYLPEESRKTQIVTNDNKTLWTFDVELEVVGGIYGVSQDDGPALLEVGNAAGGDGHLADVQGSGAFDVGGASLAWTRGGRVPVGAPPRGAR